MGNTYPISDRFALYYLNAWNRLTETREPCAIEWYIAIPLAYTLRTPLPTTVKKKTDICTLEELEMSPILSTQRDPVAARTSRFAQYSDKNALLLLQKLRKFPTAKLSTGKSLGVIFLISKPAVCDPSVVAKMYTTPRDLEVSTHRELLCLKMFSLFIFLPLFLVLVEGKGNITEGRLRRFL